MGTNIFAVLILGTPVANFCGCWVYTGRILWRRFVRPFSQKLTSENLSYTASHGTTSGCAVSDYRGGINDAFANYGGSGMTLGLLLAIFIASRRKDYREMAKMAFVPGIFNINEPVIFGLPIVLNPILVIPFVLTPFVNSLIGYVFISMELIPPIAYAVPWTTPGPLIAFLGTGGNWLALFVGLLCPAVSTLIYLPFVVAANKVNIIAADR